ncbi:MAG: PilZ domain-containing protein [Oscillospiraceae bacterium]|nr:PilZ domain-containing protein [Oscillospiraceae bacterium]
MAGSLEKPLYTDCPVIIYDEAGTMVANTTITDHFQSDMIVTVAESLKLDEGVRRVGLLILFPGGAVEYSGTIRHFRISSTEIALFGKKERCIRGSMRYRLGAPAKVKGSYKNKETLVYNPPIHVMADNISASGIGIKGPAERFAIGQLLNVSLNLNGKDVILNASVIRTQANEDGTVGYGCRLAFQGD